MGMINLSATIILLAISLIINVYLIYWTFRAAFKIGYYQQKFKGGAIGLTDYQARRIDKIMNQFPLKDNIINEQP